MIEVDELTKRYQGVPVVDALSFCVRPGSVTGFLGPNGAGKSTTMRILLGLTRPDHGSARIDGTAYRDLEFPIRRVGALLEAANPHRDLSAENHLRWLAATSGIGSDRVDTVLRDVDLEAVRRRRVGTFSLGMTQRLGLAAALLADPAVLILDEPLNGLDPEGIRWLRELLRRLSTQGRTVFVSSHLMAEMAVTADDLVIIDRGRLLAAMSTADFIEKHARTFVRAMADDPDRMYRALDEAGLPVTMTGDGAMEVTNLTAIEIGGLAARIGVRLHEISTQHTSLEDAFLALLKENDR